METKSHRVACVKTSNQIVGSLLVFACLLGSANQLRAQGTVFTYQGRLQSGTNVANGSFDLTFSICTNASGTSQVGNTITNIATPVANGMFTVTLDFGSGTFDGNPRWLEIAVRTNGGGAFTTLSPRQPLTAAPYAIYAGGVSAAGISGPITSNMLAPGAAAANLSATGQAGVPSGGTVLSNNDNDTNLTAAGYVQSGGFVSAQNLWRQLAMNPVLAARRGHAAVWTGNRMIVWGGNCGNDNPTIPPPKVRFTDGSSFDPAANTWSAIATNGAPSGREDFSTVWTSNEMIIWGGYFYDGSYHYLNDGARLNTQSNSWLPVSTNGAPAARRWHTAVWTGTEMIIWGGMSSDGGGSSLNILNDGWRFNPASNTWSQVSTNGAPSSRCLHAAIWTGSEMILWGGQSGSGLDIWKNDGARYNPTTDTWSPMNPTNAPSLRSRHTAVWTGSEMIIWGGWCNCGPYEATGGRYKPATDSWSPTDFTFAPTGRIRHTAVWTGREMIVWGGTCANPTPNCNDGGSYDPASNTWAPVSITPRVPNYRTGHSAVWTGREMIISDGADDGGNCYGDTWSCTPPQLLYLYTRP